MNTRKARLLSLYGLIAVVSALARPNSQFPVSTNVAEPTPPPETSPLLTPEKLLSFEAGGRVLMRALCLSGAAQILDRLACSIHARRS